MPGGGFAPYCYSMLIRYITVLRVPGRQVERGEMWQISKKFGTCGASGNFFSKFRETLIHPKLIMRYEVFKSSSTEYK